MKIFILSFSYYEDEVIGYFSSEKKASDRLDLEVAQSAMNAGKDWIRSLYFIEEVFVE
jgi:hypothetical protein